MRGQSNGCISELRVGTVTPSVQPEKRIETDDFTAAPPSWATFPLPASTARNSTISLRIARQISFLGVSSPLFFYLLNPVFRGIWDGEEIEAMQLFICASCLWCPLWPTERAASRIWYSKKKKLKAAWWMHFKSIYTLIGHFGSSCQFSKNEPDSPGFFFLLKQIDSKS